MGSNFSLETCFTEMKDYKNCMLVFDGSFHYFSFLFYFLFYNLSLVPRKFLGIQIRILIEIFCNTSSFFEIVNVHVLYTFVNEVLLQTGTPCLFVSELWILAFWRYDRWLNNIRVLRKRYSWEVLICISDPVL